MERPRNHILEKESRLCVESVLPSAWVIHDYIKDYGIDIQIEIFTKEGRSTGLRVYAQLKATDKSEEDEGLYLDRKHFEYWSAHSDPVLLLRFYGQTKTLKWCWMHDIEWHLKPGVNSVNAAKKLRTFDPVSTVETIERFVELRRNMISQIISSPVEVSVSIQGDIAGSLKLANLIQSKVYGGPLKFLGGAANSGCFDVVVDNDKLCITYLGLPGYVISCDSTEDLDLVAELTMLFLFLVSCRYQQSTISRAISRYSLPALYNIAKDNFLGMFIDALIYSEGVDKAISSILSQELGNENPELWAAIYFVGFKASQRYSQLDLWQVQLKKWADIPPYADLSAASAYNYANFISNKGGWEEAIKYYMLTKERDSDYSNRDYFWEELGAAQFEFGQSGLAAESYKKAFKINQSPAIEWKIGDALFHSGYFESALEYLKRSGSGAENVESYPFLLMILCEEIVGRWGIKEQSIKSVDCATHDAITKLEVNEVFEDVVKAIAPFVRLSILDPTLSFNAGHYSLICGCPELALYRFLTCALMQPGDATAWALAIASAFQSNQVRLFPLLADVGYFYCGETVIEAVFEVFKLSEISEESRVTFQEQILSAFRSAESARSTAVTLRINGSAFH